MECERESVCVCVALKYLLKMPIYSGEEGAAIGKVPGSEDYKAILIVTLMLCDIWKTTQPLWAFVSTSFKEES